MQLISFSWNTYDIFSLKNKSIQVQMSEYFQMIYVYLYDNVYDKA